MRGVSVSRPTKRKIMGHQKVHYYRGTNHVPLTFPPSLSLSSLKELPCHSNDDLHKLLSRLSWVLDHSVGVAGNYIAISIGVSWAGDLGVAHVPPVQKHHVDRAFEISSDTHVVIVGAGAAGMSAAYTLDYLKLNYTLLEASSIMGGRIRQDTTFVDVSLVLGPEWIHMMPRVLKDL